VQDLRTHGGSPSEAHHVDARVLDKILTGFGAGGKHAEHSSRQFGLRRGLGDILRYQRVSTGSLSTTTLPLSRAGSTFMPR